MDKKTFLLNLRQSLSVLKEEELQDIVSEYEQHIDMKVENGLTEEEAIADFGSMTELTAEILEAYHVRADYAESVSGRRMKADRGFGNISLQSSSNLEGKSRISEAAGKVKGAVARFFGSRNNHKEGIYMGEKADKPPIFVDFGDVKERRRIR